MPNDVVTSTYILYVDDDAALVRLVEKFFARRGMTVIHAADMEQAFEVLSARDVDAIALDHHLPGGDGLQFMKRLLGRPATPPVVYVTGSGDMNVAVAALKSGAADFVPKSVGDDFLELLGSAVDQALENARLKAEKEAADQEIRVARERAEMLVHEVNHRVANSLALVGAMVNLQLAAISDETGRTALAEMQNRLYAVAMVHKRLYTSQSVGTVDLHDYLSGLLDHLRMTVSEGQRGCTLRVVLEPLACATDYAINLGIIVTEWVTNAYKYAYPTVAGEIQVNLRSLPGQRGELNVSDNGAGIDPDREAQGTGLGTRLVKAMAQSMQGEINLVTGEAGTTFRLIFPLYREVDRTNVRPV